MVPKIGLLKFGIDRILSEEIGHKNAIEKDTSDVIPVFFNRMPLSHRDKYLQRSEKFAMNECKSLGDYFPLYTGINRNLEWALKTNAYFIQEHQNQTQRNNPIQIQGEVSTTSTKRKRSWSRAVFSNLQRKGLEKRFNIQKYITKPDRRQLAATLGLTDAQVKVWFQNRRMKWRHSKEEEKSRKKTTTHIEHKITT